MICKSYKVCKRIHCDTCNKYTNYKLVKVLRFPSYYGTPVEYCIMATHKVYKCPKCGSTVTFVDFENYNIKEENNNGTNA